MFEVVPSQIEALESKQLVQLLGRLLHAEAQRAGLALAGISVPLPTPNPYDGKLRSGPGPLFGLDEDMIFAWADKDEDRIGLVVIFYPLLDDEDVDAWHPALLRLAERYGSTKTFQEALERRIHPRSWSGSLVPMLEAYLKPIEALFEHPHRRLAGWAKDQHKKIQRRIESENAYEAERGW